MDPSAPEEGFWGGWVRMGLTAAIVNNTAYVTTPRDVARLTDIAVCQQPIHMRNGFYEYLQYSPGLQPKSCAPRCGGELQAYDRDNVVTLFNLITTEPQIIRVYANDSRDVGRRVLIQGLDQNGQVVLTTDPGTGHSAPGEYLQLKSPFVDYVYHYTRIDGLQKDETLGPVKFYQVSPTTGQENALSTMEPTEGSASYRRYLMTGMPHMSLCCTTCSPTVYQITAQARLDFIPVANETDYLTIPNVPALIEESLSIRLSRMDAPAANQRSIIHHVRALNLLYGQLDKYIGKTSCAVKMPLFGSAKLRSSFA
jgi:hypothetical protein